MADIQKELRAILAAINGEDVRGSIHDAIAKINNVAETILTIGTDVTSVDSSTEGFLDKSVYINSETFDLWKCTGPAWELEGNLKGGKGDTGESGKDGRDGIDGEDGTKWYRGSVVSGKNTTATSFEIGAAVNDLYLNTSEKAVYHCTEGGSSSSMWVYDFTMEGGGGGGGASDWEDLANKPFEDIGSDFEIKTVEGRKELNLSSEVSEKISTIDNIVGGVLWEARTYAKGETCIYNNVPYVCIKTTEDSSINPTDTEHFKPISLKELNDSLSSASSDKIFKTSTSFIEWSVERSLELYAEKGSWNAVYEKGTYNCTSNNLNQTHKNPTNYTTVNYTLFAGQILAYAITYDSEEMYIVGGAARSTDPNYIYNKTWEKIATSKEISWKKHGSYNQNNSSTYTLPSEFNELLLVVRMQSTDDSRRLTMHIPKICLTSSEQSFRQATYVTSSTFINVGIWVSLTLLRFHNEVCMNNGSTTTGLAVDVYYR